MKYKEPLAGEFPVETRDLNAAIQPAGRKSPARRGSVEARPTRET